MTVVRIKSKVLDKKAIRWTVESVADALEFLAENNIGYTFHEINSGGELIVYSIDGPRQVPFGYWIILGVKGEAYPCDPSIFEETYEVLDEV